MGWWKVNKHEEAAASPMYTICDGGWSHTRSYRSTALVFNRVGLKDLENEPYLNELFPEGFYVSEVTKDGRSEYTWDGRLIDPRPSNERTVISAEPIRASACPPDEAVLGQAPLVFCKGGRRTEIDIRKRYNACLSLFRLSGCRDCPMRGKECYAEYLGGVDKVPAGDNANEGGGSTEWKELKDVFARFQRKLRREDTLPDVAGHTFVDPGLTRLNAFDDRLRPATQHSFANVERNDEANKRRGAAGAETRKFQRLNCVKCPLNGACKRASHCPGPFDSEQNILKAAAEKFDAALKRSDFSKEQLLHLALAAKSQSKISRYKIVLVGLELGTTTDYKKMIRPTVVRKTDYMREFCHASMQTFDDYARLFELSGTVNNLATALWDTVEGKGLTWIALESLGRYAPAGWGSSYHAIAVSVETVRDYRLDRDEDTASVYRAVPAVQWAQQRWIGYTATLSNLKDVSLKIKDGEIPGFPHLERNTGDVTEQSAQSPDKEP